MVMTDDLMYVEDTCLVALESDLAETYALH